MAERHRSFVLHRSEMSQSIIVVHKVPRLFPQKKKKIYKGFSAATCPLVEVGPTNVYNTDKPLSRIWNTFSRNCTTFTQTEILNQSRNLMAQGCSSVNAMFHLFLWCSVKCYSKEDPSPTSHSKLTTRIFLILGWCILLRLCNTKWFKTTFVRNYILSCVQRWF
jgi:hypothetical protein